MKEIPLTQGLVALVDDEDYGRLANHKWTLHRAKKMLYAKRVVEIAGKQVQITMHRHLLGLEFGDPRLTDHRNRNGLDNRKENLRVASRVVNNINTRLIRCTNKSGYRGVCRPTGRRKWTASIGSEGEVHHLGTFYDPKDAAIAYDEAAKRYHGNDAVLNFPKGGK